MITLSNVNNFNRTLSFFGLSSDTKPTGIFVQDEVSRYSVTNGSVFVEIDTGDEYMFDDVSDTWVKIEGGGGASKRMVVDELPTEDIDPNTTYLVANDSGNADNAYTEYMYVNDEWEALGPYVANVWVPGAAPGSAMLSGNKSSISSSATYAVAEGYRTIASNNNAHAEGGATTASGQNSHAEGSGSTASGSQSHAEGGSTTASGINSHAEGGGTQANGSHSHAEGGGTTASGQSSHAEGGNTIASGSSTHAEGYDTTAKSESAHAEGFSTLASAPYAHAEGQGGGKDKQGNYNTMSYRDRNYTYGAWSVAAHSEGVKTVAGTGDLSKRGDHAEGINTIAIGGEGSHAEGNGSGAIGASSHAEGGSTYAGGLNSHAEGVSTEAEGDGSHAEGSMTMADGTYAHVEGQGAGKDSHGSYKPIFVNNTMYFPGAHNLASHAEGYETSAGEAGSSGSGQHSEGYHTVAIGDASHAEGYNTVASNNNAHAEGNSTTADGVDSHAEGTSNTASGAGSHAEGGGGNTASGDGAHAEGGGGCRATAYGAHAEGSGTTASGPLAHAEGGGTFASAQNSHAEGGGTTASSSAAHAEGGGTTASGQDSHAEGVATEAKGTGSHAEGNMTTADGGYAHAEGQGAGKDGKGNYITITINDTTYIPGAHGQASHAEGCQTVAGSSSIKYSHAEGYQTVAIGDASHAEGYSTIASNTDAHAEGAGTKASGNVSHAEGSITTASGNVSHAEGTMTTASGDYSHAEGDMTTASGQSSHAEGQSTTASGRFSHAEGDWTKASGAQSHAEGYYTTANHASQHVFGEYNIEDGSSALGTERGSYIEIVGNGEMLNGSSTIVRSNARTLDWNGNEWLAGNVSVEDVMLPLEEGSDTRTSLLDKIAELSSSSGGGSGIKREIVNTLPTTDIDPDTIYLITNSDGSGDNTYIEYMYVNDAWEALGSYIPDIWGRGTGTNSAIFKGENNTATGANAIAEGGGTTASGDFSHAEGRGTEAIGVQSHTEGGGTKASGNQSHAEGGGTKASGNQSHSEGNSTNAFGDQSHSEGSGTVASGDGSHAEGGSTEASGKNSHSEGAGTKASGVQSHAEGGGTEASGVASHAEGGGTIASGDTSHAEGAGTEASGVQSHAEGGGTRASGNQSHSEGSGTVASGGGSHAEGGSTIASGEYSHAEGGQTIANHKSQHVFGEWNIEDDSSALGTERGNYIEIVGNGEIPDGGSTAVRSNARTLDWSGNEWLAGNVSVEDVMLPLEDGSNTRTSLLDKLDAFDTDVTNLSEDITNLSTNITNVVAQQVEQMQIHEGQTVIDSTLTVQGAAADAKKTGDELTNLKSDLTNNGKTTETQISFSSESGKLINKNTGAVSDTSSTTYYVSNPIPVSVGDVYKISVNMRYDNGVVAFYNGDTVVSVIGASTAGTGTSPNFEIRDYEATVPNGATIMRIAFYNYNDIHTVYKKGEFVLLNPNWKNKKWVCIGDSLTADNEATTKHYFDYVADVTGILPVNMGANGTGYAKSSGSGEAFYNRVANVPTDADVVTIFGSFNDLSSGLEIGSVDDTGTTTIAGCINTTITNLQALIPLINLGIVAPTPWSTTQPNFAETSNSYKYVNILKMICERRSIPFLDLWRRSNLHPWDASFRSVAYTKDNGGGTHPDENGHKLIAPRFKGFLETLLM